MYDIYDNINDNSYVIAIWNKKLNCYVNSYVIKTSDRNIFIDSGDADDIEKIIA